MGSCGDAQPSAVVGEVELVGGVMEDGVRILELIYVVGQAEVSGVGTVGLQLVVSPGLFQTAAAVRAQSFQISQHAKPGFDSLACPCPCSCLSLCSCEPG